MGLTIDTGSDASPSRREILFEFGMNLMNSKSLVPLQNRSVHELLPGKTGQLGGSWNKVHTPNP